MRVIISADEAPDHLFATPGELSERDKFQAKVLMADLDIKQVNITSKYFSCFNG